MTGPGGVGPLTPPGLPTLWAPGFEPKWGTSPFFGRQKELFIDFFRNPKHFVPQCNHFVTTFSFLCNRFDKRMTV
jgi:hypothetical protein